jgi:hypothetical protein
VSWQRSISSGGDQAGGSLHQRLAGGLVEAAEDREDGTAVAHVGVDDVLGVHPDHGHGEEGCRRSRQHRDPTVAIA